MTGGTLEILLSRLAGGPQLCRDEIAGITPEQWEALDARAAEHRLRPLLHYRWGSHKAVPSGIRGWWAEAHRDSAIAALGQRRALFALVDRLAEAGIPAIALKGAWLTWHCYPEPALRPLRDLDLLLRLEDAPRARALLLAEGWDEPVPSALPPEQWLARFKHLPELRSPEGYWLDLHVRLWDLGGPTAQPAGLWERARPDPSHPALLYLSREDQLMHLALHAANHRFDAGPLMLADFDRLLAQERFDWPAVLARAEREGWIRPLALVLEATRVWGCQGIWRGPEGLPPVPPRIMEDIPLLLAKPLSARASDIGAAKRGREDVGSIDKLSRVWARRKRYATTGEYLRWLAGEITLAVAARRDASLAQRAQGIARIDAFLRGA